MAPPCSLYHMTRVAEFAVLVAYDQLLLPGRVGVMAGPAADLSVEEPYSPVDLGNRFQVSFPSPPEPRSLIVNADRVAAPVMRKSSFFVYPQTCLNRHRGGKGPIMTGYAVHGHGVELQERIGYNVPGAEVRFLQRRRMAFAPGELLLVADHAECLSLFLPSEEARRSSIRSVIIGMHLMARPAGQIA